MSLFRPLFNHWQFGWRNRQAKAYAPTTLPTLAQLAAGLPALPQPWLVDQAQSQQVHTLATRYGLTPPAVTEQPFVKAPFSQYPSQIQAESLSLLDLLDQWVAPHWHTFNVPTDTPRQYLDIGSKNWPYLPGQHAFLNTLHPTTPLWHLTGVELDGYRRYQDGFRRCDYAHALAQPFAHNTTYQVADIRDITPPLGSEGWAGVMWLLPFVWRDPHLAWGLPSHLFAPQALLAHVVAQLAPGGWLLTVHLTAEEADEQDRLMHGVDGTGKGMQLLAHGPVSDRFRQFTHQRVARLWKKIPHSL
jgi:hypothetical protein